MIPPQGELTPRNAAQNLLHTRRFALPFRDFTPQAKFARPLFLSQENA
ncbi:hypothetical protein [Rahnella sp. PCH160]